MPARLEIGQAIPHQHFARKPGKQVICFHRKIPKPRIETTQRQQRGTGSIPARFAQTSQADERRQSTYRARTSARPEGRDRAGVAVSIVFGRTDRNEKTRSLWDSPFPIWLDKFRQFHSATDEHRFTQIHYGAITNHSLLAALATVVIRLRLAIRAEMQRQRFSFFQPFQFFPKRTLQAQ